MEERQQEAEGHSPEDDILGEADGGRKGVDSVIDSIGLVHIGSFG